MSLRQRSAVEGQKKLRAPIEVCSTPSNLISVTSIILVACAPPSHWKQPIMTLASPLLFKALLPFFYIAGSIGSEYLHCLSYHSYLWDSKISGNSVFWEQSQIRFSTVGIFSSSAYSLSFSLQPTFKDTHSTYTTYIRRSPFSLFP